MIKPTIQNIKNQQLWAPNLHYGPDSLLILRHSEYYYLHVLLTVLCVQRVYTHYAYTHLFTLYRARDNRLGWNSGQSRGLNMQKKKNRMFYS